MKISGSGQSSSFTAAISGRADLIRAYSAGGEKLQHYLARWLGYQIQKQEQVSLASPSLDQATFQIQTDIIPASSQSSLEASMLFYRVSQHQQRAPAVEITRGLSKKSSEISSISHQEISPPKTIWRDCPQPKPFLPLAPSNEILPRLLSSIARKQSGHQADIPRLADHLSRGHLLTQLYYLPQLQTVRHLWLIKDWSHRLIPYRKDQLYLIDLLKKHLPQQSITVAVVGDDHRPPQFESNSLSRTGTCSIPPESTIIVLSDLGYLDLNSHQARNYWVESGHHYQHAGHECFCVYPGHPGNINRSPNSSDPQQFWQLIPWQHNANIPTQNSQAEATEKLLRHLSPAVRIEREFLREMRLNVPETTLDSGYESYIWQHVSVTKHGLYVLLNPEKHSKYRTSLSLQEYLTSLQKTRHWRTENQRSIWFEELISYPGNPANVVPGTHDLEDAQNYFQRWSQALLEGHRNSGTLRWIRRFCPRLLGNTWQLEGFSQPLLRLYWAVHQNDSVHHLPPDFDPALLANNNHPQQKIQIRQVGHQIQFFNSEDQTKELPGSPVGEILLQREEILIAPNTKPSWATVDGQDEFGVWADLEVNEIMQRLRWIAPGEFLMGSPKPEQYPDEGPQHPVQLTQGFWLFDTPCTQALWTAVMGNNPSHYKSPNHPVGNVIWEDCQKFIQQLNGLIPGLELGLPSEAQWEYACRAGSQSSTYSVELPLGELAWYDENSGNKTHAVKEKRPNPWGLYDMLGNIWEWCADHWKRDYTEQPVVDPVHIQKSTAAANRVIRGGSFGNIAGLVRCAFRNDGLPSHQARNLGFRCAGFSETSQPQPGAKHRGVKSSVGGLREGHPLQRRRGNSQPVLIQLDKSADSCDLRQNFGQTSRIRIITDLQSVVIEKAPPPVWSVGSGRDESGLWADLEVNEVIQRLRWIPPGKFRMGSPVDEVGRHDDEGPQHPVQLTQGFWLFDTPCTQEMWRAVMGEDPKNFEGESRKNHPVAKVNWYVCQEFVQRINQLITGLSLGLPNDAQWEYACRAGTEGPTYNSEHPLGDLAWYSQNGDGKTHPVKGKLPNPWGVYDMLGNVWEWCQDTWYRYSDNELKIDPVHNNKLDDQKKKTAYKICRGGCWFEPVDKVRSACRHHWPPTSSHQTGMGFRCADFS